MFDRVINTPLFFLPFRYNKPIAKVLFSNGRNNWVFELLQLFLMVHKLFPIIIIHIIKSLNLQVLSHLLLKIMVPQFKYFWFHLFVSYIMHTLNLISTLILLFIDIWLDMWNNKLSQVMKLLKVFLTYILQWW